MFITLSLQRGGLIVGLRNEGGRGSSIFYVCWQTRVIISPWIFFSLCLFSIYLLFFLFFSIFLITTTTTTITTKNNFDNDNDNGNDNGNDNVNDNDKDEDNDYDHDLLFF